MKPSQKVAAFCALLAVAALPQAGLAQSTTRNMSCERLAHRQPLAGSPNTTFRVERMHFPPGTNGELHSHKGSEIVYLLSGSGTNTMNGQTTVLSKDEAIVVQPGVQHSLTPTNGTTL